MTEAIGSGTAVVISPVGRLSYKNETLQLNGGNAGAVTRTLYDSLTGIQTGRLEDPFGWLHFVN